MGICRCGKIGLRLGKGMGANTAGGISEMPVQDVDAALEFPKRMLRYDQFSTIVDLAGAKDLPSVDAVKAMAMGALGGATIVLMNAPRGTREFIADTMALPELQQFTEYFEMVDFVSPRESLPSGSSNRM